MNIKKQNSHKLCPEGVRGPRWRKQSEQHVWGLLVLSNLGPQTLPPRPGKSVAQFWCFQIFAMYLGMYNYNSEGLRPPLPTTPPRNEE